MNDSITSQSNLVTEGQETIKSFTHKEDGTIEVVTVVHPQISTWPETPKKAVKRTYIACDGKIILGEEIEGKVIPEKTIPERIEWQTETEELGRN